MTLHSPDPPDPPRLRPGSHPEHRNQKRPPIRLLLNDLSRRLPGAVARLGLNADQHRGGARLGGLQRRGELEGVTPLVELEAGRHYRIRLININPSVPLTFSVRADSLPIAWRAVAKDGAELPVAQARMGPAQLRIGVGETYDFDFAPNLARDLSLEVRDPGGVVRVSGLIRVRPLPQ